MSVDPHAVLAVGRRRRQRRRLVAEAGTVAATLVLGVGAWTPISGPTDDEQTRHPTSPTASVSLPKPVAELYLGTIPPTGRTLPLVAAVGYTDSGQRMVYSLRTEDGLVVASRQVPLGESENPRWATLIPGVTMAVLPAGSTGAAPVWTRRHSAHGTMATAMPDGRVLAAWWTDGRSRMPFRNVVWTDGRSRMPFGNVVWTDGESFHTAYADSLSSVVVDEHVFFAGGSGGLLGFFAPPAGSDPVRHGEATAARSVDEGTIPAVWAEGSGASGGTYATYLPPVREVELVTSDGAEVRDLVVHDLPDETGVLVTAHVDGDHDSVTDVRYTDLDGRSTTVPAPTS